MSNKTHTFSKTYFYLILTFVLWGSNYVVSKYVVGQLPAFTISFLRFFLSFLFLSLISKKPEKKLERNHLPYVFCIGFGGYFISVGAQLLGTKLAGASMASLLNSLNPVTIAIFGALLLHEALTARKILGILLAIFGVVVIFSNQITGAGPGGILLSLFAVLGWSFVSVLTRKVSKQYDPLYITRIAVGIAAICYLPLAGWEVFSGSYPVIEVLTQDMSCILSLLYMSILCTGVSYVLWNKSLSQLDASVCSAFYPIQPLVSTLFGILFLQEQVTWRFAAGALLIVAGVLISLSRKRENGR